MLSLDTFACPVPDVLLQSAFLSTTQITSHYTLHSAPNTGFHLLYISVVSSWSLNFRSRPIHHSKATYFLVIQNLCLFISYHHSSMSPYHLSDWKISSLHHVYFDRESSERLVLTGYALPQDGRRQSLGPIPRCRAGKTMGKVLQKSAPAWITCSCVCHERSYHTFSLRDSANLGVIICTLFVRL